MMTNKQFTIYYSGFVNKRQVKLTTRWGSLPTIADFTGNTVSDREMLRIVIAALKWSGWVVDTTDVEQYL